MRRRLLERRTTTLICSPALLQRADVFDQGLDLDIADLSLVGRHLAFAVGSDLDQVSICGLGDFRIVEIFRTHLIAGRCMHFSLSAMAHLRLGGLTRWPIVCM